jgi:hypothetical protein
VAALVLVAATAGCTPDEQAMIQQYCQQNQAACADLVKIITEPSAPTGQPGTPPGPSVPPAPPGTVTAEAINADATPQALQDWADHQRQSTAAAYQIITSGGYTYCALAGGLKPTGGYKTELTAVAQQNGVWQITARVVPPAPGSIVSMHLENPMAFYRMPKLDGTVKVLWVTDGTGPASGPVKALISATWQNGNMLHVTGQATVADVHLAANVGGKVVAQAHAQVKDGRFEANLLVPSGPVNLTLTVSTVEPGGGKLIQTLKVTADVIARDEVWSTNFRVSRPVQTDADHILLEGTARAFEAVFRVEVWAGGRKIAGQTVQAAAGAPAFGRFSVSVQVPGGVPAGARVRYIIDSMKDGSSTTELALPVAMRLQVR